MTDEAVSAETRRELKPCPVPWCRSRNVAVGYAAHNCFVRCGNCGATGPSAGLPSEAIAAWETRPTIEVSEEYVEAIVAANQPCVGDEDSFRAGIRAAIAVPRPDPIRPKPFCVTCGEGVAEVLCPDCAKWWNDNPPPDPILPAGEVGELVEKLRVGISMAPRIDECCSANKTMAEAADLLTHQQAVMDEMAEALRPFVEAWEDAQKWADFEGEDLRDIYILNTINLDEYELLATKALTLFTGTIRGMGDGGDA